jgi:hypothetical protein
MLAQKLECTLARQRCRLRLVVLPLITIEAVTCIVGKHRQFRILPANGVNF